MKVLVLGATGATGRLVVKQLINRGIEVKAIVRKDNNVLKDLRNQKFLECVKGNISDFYSDNISELISDCNAVISCLGHNINFRGIFGPPYRLVSKTAANIIEAMQSQAIESKFILMSTIAYTNRKIGEVITLGEKVVFWLLELLLPPHKDNMIAAHYLVDKLSTNNNIGWVAVRPDSLFNKENVSKYEVCDKKRSGALFNPGNTSRINVSNFIAELITNEKLWQEWKYKTPVIYNIE